jgi:hypothetical protein
MERCISGAGNVPIAPNAEGAKVENTRLAIRFLPPRLWAGVEHGSDYRLRPKLKIVDLIQQ